MDGEAKVWGEDQDRPVPVQVIWDLPAHGFIVKSQSWANSNQCRQKKTKSKG